MHPSKKISVILLKMYVFTYSVQYKTIVLGNLVLCLTGECL